MTALPAAALLRAALPYALAFAAGAAAAWYFTDREWGRDYAELELDLAGFQAAVATARAKGLAEGQRLAGENARRTEEAANARAAELAAIATRADAQLRGVLRLCNNPARPVPAAGAGGGAHAADQPAAAARVVPGGVAAPGAVLDPEFIRERLNRAEQVAADLRTCMAAWPR